MICIQVIRCAQCNKYGGKLRPCCHRYICESCHMKTCESEQAKLAEALGEKYDTKEE